MAEGIAPRMPTGAAWVWSGGLSPRRPPVRVSSLPPIPSVHRENLEMPEQARRQKAAGSNPPLPFLGPKATSKRSKKFGNRERQRKASDNLVDCSATAGGIPADSAPRFLIFDRDAKSTTFQKALHRFGHTTSVSIFSVRFSREEAARLSRHPPELPVREDLRSGSARARRPTHLPEIPPAERCPSRPHRRPGAAGCSGESLPRLDPTKMCTYIRLSCTASRIPLASPR